MQFIVYTMMKFVRGIMPRLLVPSCHLPFWTNLVFSVKIRNHASFIVELCLIKTVQSKNGPTSLSSSSRVNSFFFTTFSWFLKLNSAAFFWSLANLFSYLETFFKVGLTLKTKTQLLWFMYKEIVTRNRI